MTTEFDVSTTNTNGSDILMTPATFDATTGAVATPNTIAIGTVGLLNTALLTEGDISHESATGYTLTGPDAVVSFTGTGLTFDSHSLAGDTLSAGTITGFAVTDNGGQPLFSVSGAALDAKAAASWLADISADAAHSTPATQAALAADNASLSSQLFGSSVVIHAGAGDDVLLGFGGSNTLFGGDGDDQITGGLGSNVINGNAGDDAIVGMSKVGDTLLGGQGDDTIDATKAGASNVINGNLGADTIHGSDHGDIIHGGQGDDLIVGGAGADNLFADLGNNTLTGGKGADVFHVGSAGVQFAPTPLTAPDHGVSLTGSYSASSDVITDFNAKDGDTLSFGQGVTVVGISGDHNWLVTPAVAADPTATPPVVGSPAVTDVETHLFLSNGAEVTLAHIASTDFQSSWIV